MADVRRAADRFLQLADQYAASGNTRMEAQCRYQRAQSLGRGRKAAESLVQSGNTSALLDLRKERAAEYEHAAELFRAVGLVGDAGRSWYKAAYEYNGLGMQRPEYREKCYSMCGIAAEHLGAAGDWWGRGMAEFLAGQTLRTGVIGGPPDPRSVPALRHAAEAFTRADRPVESAAAGMTAAVTLTQTGGAEWITTAVEALHTYEQARPSLRIPKDREINDRTIVANGTRVLTSKVSRSADTMSHHPVWQEFIWLLSEAPKGRSLQDQHLQDDTWSQLAADDGTLSELMTRRKVLTREQSDLKQMIKATLITRSDDEVQVMEQRLRRKEQELEDIDRQVARRFQRLYHDTPEQIELLSTAPVTPEELQACLEPGEAYISYRWNDGAPLRTVVTGSSVTSGLATGVSSEFATAAVKAGRNGKVLHSSDFPNADRLIGPVPGEIDTLIISPDSLLLGLPWHQLPSPGPSNPNLTLGDRYTITVVPAAGVLRHLRAHRPSVERGGRDNAYLGVACDAEGARASSSWTKRWRPSGGTTSPMNPGPAFS